MNPPAAKFQISQLGCGSALQHARDASQSPLDVRQWPGEPPIFVCQTKDVLYLPSALAAGQSLQVIADSFVPVEAIFDQETLEFVKQRRIAKNVISYDDDFDVQHVDQDVCILGNVFSRNFTHWHEELFKVCILRAAGIECDFVLSGLPAFARESLRLLGIPESRIHETDRPTRFRSAFYATPINYDNVWQYPGLLLSLRHALLAAAETDPPDLGPRLWLDRGEQTRLGRKLINTEEVFRCLEEFDFQRFDMGAVPLARQIAVAQRMQAIAGLHGSQFVHTQLMPPKSLVVECFSPLHMNPTYTSIYHVLDHRYCQITGQNTAAYPHRHGGDMEIDCLQLRLALRQA